MDDLLRQKILALLDGHRIMTISTLRPDGWPQATTVGYVSDEDPTITPSTRERAVRVLTPVAFAVMAWRWEATTVLVPFLFLVLVTLLAVFADFVAP